MGSWSCQFSSDLYYCIHLNYCGFQSLLFETSCNPPEFQTKIWKVQLGITLRAMPQLRQQCADVGSRMKMQQVYAQQCVQSLGWQIWNLEWSVLPRQRRSFLDSNSRAMRIWIQQTFIWPFLNLTSQFVKGPLLATQGPFWWPYFWSLKWCTDILMTISTLWCLNCRGEASLCLPISGMAQVKCTILKAGRVGSLV